MDINKWIPEFLLSPQCRWQRHLIMQVVIFLITINIFWDTPDRFIFTPERMWGWIGYFFTINTIVYLNNYLFIPRFLLKGRLYGYLISILLTIFLALVLVITLEITEEGTATPMLPVAPAIILLTVLSSILSLGLLLAGTTSFILYRNWIINTQRAQELSTATLKSELKLLKSQINPHFLFNMLNNAILLIKKKRVEAASVLFMLEDLLRYQLKDSAEEVVLLTSDIRFLDDFLNLEKLRRDDFKYSISREGDLHKVILPPLLFIPFVENAVKHSQDNVQGSFVHLSFSKYGSKLSFSCENSLPEEVLPSDCPGGLGLKNIQRRLELLFPDNYQLDIVNNGVTYKINLELNI